MNTKWLVWSNEHQAWWRPNQHGYTTERKQAGHYSLAEATEIVAGANTCVRGNVPMETMCPVFVE